MLHRDQYGGTAIIALGRLCNVITSIGQDTTGLGRWTWLCLHSQGGPTTFVVSTYFPHRTIRKQSFKTVEYQHSLYYQSQGDFRPPCQIFQEDLLNMIRPWQEKGYKVVLGIDANQNVYNGPLAKALGDAPFFMNCLIKETLGCPVPNSHHRGTEPITTIFGLPGLVTDHAICFPHWYGLGDHRLFVIEVASASLFGGRYPSIGRPGGRLLNC